MKVGVLFTRMRTEEKLIVEALRRRGIQHDLISDEALALDLDRPWTGCDAVLSRSLGHWRALHALWVLEAWGVPTLSPSRVAQVCGNKLATTLALLGAGLPVPRTAVAFSAKTAKETAGRLGYPVVAKPVVGSWGRLLARLSTPEEADAIIEHKEALASPLNHIYYLQEYVNKPDRDIRSFVIGDRTVCAIYRSSPHWITNTARGGVATPCPVTPEVDRLSRGAARAVGGGAVAVDLLEDGDGRLLVNEVNHTMEFRNAAAVTGVDVAGLLIEYLVELARGRTGAAEGGAAAAAEGGATG